MRKYIFFTITILCLVCVQRSFAKRWSFAPELGANFANYKITEYDINNSIWGTKPRAGIVAGLAAHLDWTQQFRVAFGLHYTEKGYAYKNMLWSDVTKIKCVELSVDALFAPKCTEGKLFVGGGAYLTHNNSGSRNIDGRIMPLVFSPEGSFGAPVSRSEDYGWRLVALVNVTERLYVKSVFQHGLKSLYEYNPAYPPYDSRSYGLIVTGGYRVWGTQKGKRSRK